MKITIISLFIILMYTFSLADEKKSSGFKILMTGNFHGSDVSYVDGDLWYGLFKTDSGQVLEPVEIIAEAWHDAIVDEPGDTTGISIRVKHALKPILLVQPQSKIRAGLIRNIPNGSGQIEPGKLFSLDGYYLTALGNLTDEGFRHPGDLLILDYRIKLFSGDKRQVLIEYAGSSYDGLPSVLWAGDLDGDGQLDLLLDIRNHYNVRHYALFLSSKAEGNELVKLVADLRLVGC